MTFSEIHEETPLIIESAPIYDTSQPDRQHYLIVVSVDKASPHMHAIATVRLWIDPE